MGVVYKARHRGLNRLVALKMVLAGEFASETQRQRFRLEAELAARMQHPHIVQVYEVGVHEGRPFLAMEWVEGGTLTDRLDGVPWPPLAAARLVATLGRSIDATHRQGVIHRDLKPSNILLQPGEDAEPADGLRSSRVGDYLSGLLPKLADFGLARSALGDGGLTATGFVVGTPEYMAPEHAEARPCQADPAADVYSLGAILYELLTGRPPFKGATALETLEQVRSADPVPPSRLVPGTPQDVETIALKCLQKDPARRYESAAALAADLRKFLAGEPILARQASAAERHWRRARRNPTIAVLGGVLAGVLVLATIGSSLAAQRFRTQADIQRTLAVASETERQAADRARAKEAAANAGLRANEEELRRTVYTTRSNLALAAWDNNDVGGLRTLLGLMRPSPGEPDPRGWDWRYLWKLGHEDRLTLRSDVEQDRFLDVVFSPDGGSVAGLDRRGRIRIWDHLTGQLRRTMGATSQGQAADLRRGVSSLAFSPDGRSLAAPGPDASLVLYAADTGRPTFRFEGPPGAVLELAWSPDGRTLVAATSAHVMRMWDTRDGHLIHDVFGGHSGPVSSVAFSPDGRTLASASFDHTVKLWDPEDPNLPRAVLEGHTDEVRAVAFSPDGRRIVSAGADRTGRVWDARSGAALALFWGHTGAVTSLAYLPDGVRVATGSMDETVRVWDAATGQELRTFKGTHSIAAVAVSPDGRDIAAAGDVTVRVWDAASPPRPRTLQSPSVLKYGAGVECLAFSPDGRKLVSGHVDHALRVWELPSGRPLRVIKGHTGTINCVAFSPDGRTVASGSVDRTVRLWDAAGGEPRITFTGHTDELRGLIFTPDGRTRPLDRP